MKFKINFTLLLMCILLQINCSKKNHEGDEVISNVYQSNCTIKDIFWLADSETILLNDQCEGTLKKINTTTGAIQYFDLDAREHLIEKLFYTEQLPAFAFYTANTKDASGVYSGPLKLFSLDLSNGQSNLIVDSISEQVPYFMRYVPGNKKFAVSSGSQTLVVDLENSTSEYVPISGNIRCFSPDDNKILVSYVSETVADSVYDLSCHCMQPSTLTGYGLPLWRPQGIYKYLYKVNGDLEFSDLQSGAILNSFPGFNAGPWVAQNGTMCTFMVKGPNYASDQLGILKAYNLADGQSRELLTATQVSNTYNIGIFLAAVSPNQMKVAYVYNGMYLRVVGL